MPDVSLTAFLTARWDEWETWAHEASLFDDYPAGSYVEGGMHWRWETGYGEPIELDPTTMAYADEGAARIRGNEAGLLLSSTETRMTSSVGEMSELVIQGAYEVRVPVAVHIALNDPAYVLADIAGKRALLADYQLVIANNMDDDATHSDEVRAACRNLMIKTLRMALFHLASPFSGHPDYKPERWIE